MQIVHSVKIATTPDRLYDAITTTAGLSGWWTPRATAEPRVGAVNEFQFGRSMRLAFRIDRLDPTRHVSWSPVDVPPDWKETRLTFDIDPADAGVELVFRQDGFAPDYHNLGAFNYLWAQYLRRLKLLLETGTGEPYGSAPSRAAGTTPTETGPVGSA
jgi:uncharacterized protein YndB with AHSA1/START domain